MSALVIGGLEIETLNLVNQWGLSPASGTITAVGNGGVAEGDEVSISVGGFTFSGICTSVEQVVDHGVVWHLTVTDYREHLKDEVVYGFFNRPEIIEDDWTTPGIDRKKRYVHLYPVNYGTYTYTRTEKPLTAKEILTKVFSAPTLQYDWSLQDHSRLAMATKPIDCETGKELGVVLQEVLDACGLVVTIEDTTLRFGVQGEGEIPPFPLNSKNRRLGQSLPQRPTWVNVVGDRNRYQLFNIALEPSWNRNWEGWWGEMQFLERMESWFGPYGDTKAGLAKRAADARTVTVRQVVEQAGVSLADYGMWGEVSRMEIPAWIYLQDILFKAYRIPRSLTVNATPLSSTELIEMLIVPVTYGATDGKHRVDESTKDYYLDTKAFVTIQGQPLDVWDPTRSGEFEPNLLQEARTRWQGSNRFNLDTKNYAVLFQEAVFRDGTGDGSLLTFPNQDVDDLDDDLRYLAVPNANATIEPAPIYGTFCFAAERFAKAFGTGSWRDTIHQPDLRKDIVRGQAGPVEIAYADGEKADEKAKEIADRLLDGPTRILSGGYERIGEAGTTLTGAMSSVGITVNFSQGLTESVQFANDRVALQWDSDRELERKRKSAELFPGQERLRDEARQLRETSLHLKAASRHTQRHYQNLGDVQMRPVTNREPNPKVVRRAATATPLQAGDCLWRNESGDVGAEGDEFVGVVIPSAVTGADVPVARQGLVPVRVQGPVRSGEELGCNPATESAEAETIARPGGGRHVGRAMATYEGTEIILIPVMIGAPGDRPLRQLSMTGGVDSVRIYFGQVYGMGHSGLIQGLTDSDWTEFPVSSATAFYLKITFDPVPTDIVVYAAEEVNETIWAVGSGGTNAVVEVIEQSGAAPVDKDPVVNAETGDVVEAAEYYIRLGTARVSGSAVTVVPDGIYGPLSLGFCAPSTPKVFEMIAP